MPDRFDAIARNFYWLNVTRFFAGCLDKGEIPALIDRLQVLALESDYKYTNYPRTLAATLLSDWVFTQQPRHLRQVIDLVLDDTGMRYLLASSRSPRSENTLLSLPDKCGRSELIDKCFNLLDSQTLQSDYVSSITDLIRENAAKSEILTRWLSRIDAVSAQHKGSWLMIGRNLGCLSLISLQEIERLIPDAELNGQRLGLLLSARRMDYLESTEARFDKTVDAILDRVISGFHQPKNQSLFDLLSTGLEARYYSWAFRHHGNVPLSDLWFSHPEKIAFSMEHLLTHADYEGTDKIVALVDTIQSQLGRSVNEWITTLAPWDNIVEHARSLWGERFLLLRLAVIAAGIKSTKDTGAGHPDLLDPSKSLCMRMRYARLKSGVKSWWRSQLTKCKTKTEILTVLLPLLAWGSGKTITALLPLIQSVLDSLGKEVELILTSVRIADPINMESRKIWIEISDLPNDTSSILAAILYQRCKHVQKEKLYLRYMADCTGSDYWVLRSCQEQILLRVQISGEMSVSDLDFIARAYAAGVTTTPYAFQNLARTNLEWLKIQLAEKISRKPERYPGFLVSASQKKFRNQISANMVPVGDIAQRDGWFLESTD